MDVENNGNCSLVEAILSANTGSSEDACEAGDPSLTDADIIVLPPDTLFSSAEAFAISNRLLPNIGAAIVIEGNGSTLERAPDAVNKFGILRVVSGGITLRDLTLKNGDATDPQGEVADGGADGGAVLLFGSGDISFENVRFLNNRARDGGAYYSPVTARPKFIDCVFTDNSATRNGGAIAQPRQSGIQRTNAAVIINGLFESNEASSGGALWIERNGLEIGNSTFTGNTAEVGGAISLEFTYLMSLANSTIHGNTATRSSYGGIYAADGGDLRIRNSTISGNFGLEEGRGFQIGQFGRGSAWIENSTILHASFPADSFSAAIDIRTFFYLIYNSVIGGCLFDVSQPDRSVSLGNWFIYESCDGDADGSPQLGPLSDNGGPTLTYAPQDGSPLVNGGIDPQLGGAGVLFSTELDEFLGDIDQRGFARSDGAIDIGSVEIQPPTGFDALTPGQRAAVILLLQNRAEDEEAP